MPKNFLTKASKKNCDDSCELLNECREEMAE